MAYCNDNDSHDNLFQGGFLFFIVSFNLRLILMKESLV